ncbi:Zinc finger, C2H2-type/integrase, DNA-binding [Penicillium camemberti]|uniref:Zinc finger, C2H2-type/integrase, DNA-binding n=1 Tax=Penicillium camemberti (strain FM 013) TaxID=1429867 RepID=A0A0G4PSP6_PENC3|nr:Zinc finger, C2H2-type/integrase, DNA-binding [Penicillium camemberti]
MHSAQGGAGRKIISVASNPVQTPTAPMRSCEVEMQPAIALHANTEAISLIATTDRNYCLPTTPFNALPRGGFYILGRKSDLSRHYSIHTNERLYHCSVKGCNKSFIQRSALTVHSRAHTGEKPHLCDQVDCKKAFSDVRGVDR